ncbi:MAG TPA: magnesium transporter CorA family protein [Burkholderiaceae bacterium]
MRLFHLHGEQFRELPDLAAASPVGGFLWLSCGTRELESQLAAVQNALQTWAGSTLLDLHVSDLLNAQLPSHFDYTSAYDLLVFRRLAAAPGSEEAAVEQVLKRIDTSPVGFAIFPRVLLTVHPGDCQVRDFFAAKLGKLSEVRDLRGSARMPQSTDDLMLRMVNHMVDSYLDLRRVLSRHSAQLQKQLLNTAHQFDDWTGLQDSRDALHHVEETCEDQRSAVQEWLDALEEVPSTSPQQHREFELLRVRGRDALEHIERVLSHVRRLENSAESAVQMHFSALGHRTNQIMRTLTVLTAIFLPLNLITGIFGMNFDSLPLIHRNTGVWIALTLMLAVALGLGLIFWRKRYLSSK